jgi:hypothetical protein
MHPQSTNLLLHRAEESAQTSGPGAARYRLVCILHLALEVVGRGRWVVLGALRRRGGVLRVGLLLYVIVCRVHGCDKGVASYGELCSYEQ